MAYRGNDSQRKDDKIRYDVYARIGVLSKRSDSGWTREVNLISWNGRPAKIDIREWDPRHVRMSRGITLTEEEAEVLARALAARYGLRPGRYESGPARPQSAAQAAAPALEQPVQTESDAEGSRPAENDREMNSAAGITGTYGYPAAGEHESVQTQDDIPFEGGNAAMSVAESSGILYEEGYDRDQESDPACV